uniref:Ig-like domain-containing protein n=1 Tax=Taeniopygia guttata TaxID=59729 RepID=A0A674HRG2_TAEGU
NGEGDPKPEPEGLGVGTILCPALTAVFQFLGKFECYFTNGTEKVRYVHRYLYNREQLAMFDSDVGVYVGFNPLGEKWARCWNSDPEFMERKRAEVDIVCRHNYRLYAPFSVERRVPPSVSISLVPSSSQPGPGRLLCSVLDFYPAPIQVRWFQGQQELSEHVVATEVVPNGDWSYQLLVLLETPPRRGLTYSCQVEHGSLEHPLKMPPDAARSKMLTGIGGFVLGSLFLALGLGFYLRSGGLSAIHHGEGPAGPGSCSLGPEPPLGVGTFNPS